MPEQDNNEGFFLRWSRKKRGAEQPAQAKAPVADNLTPQAVEETKVAFLDQHHEVISNDSSMGDVPSVQESDSASEKAAHAEVAPHDLENVDIDAMDYESDYTGFMKDGVPEALKRKALRQLWRSDPILANVDGLCDYDDDFTDAALAVDVLKTVHKVGKGYLTDDEDEADDTDELEVAGNEENTLAETADEPVSVSDEVASAEQDSDAETSDRVESADADAIGENTPANSNKSRSA